MKPRAEGGVLDPSLNVFGTRHLKVAELVGFITSLLMSCSER